MRERGTPSLPRKPSDKIPLDERREFLFPAFSLCRVIELKLSSRTRLARQMYAIRIRNLLRASRVSDTIYNCLLPRLALCT